MTHVSEVEVVDVLRFLDLGGDKILVVAIGQVPTSGWSGFRLAQRYTSRPPADGLMEMDLLGDAPGGRALDVTLPAMATRILSAPDWLKGVRVYAACGCVVVTELRRSELVRCLTLRPILTNKSNGVLCRQDLASFDENFSPIDSRGGPGPTSMRKLRHTLMLTAEGPNETKIRRCIAEALELGFGERIVAAYAIGGGALSTAISALLSHLESCLGDGFTTRIDDDSEWIKS
jgi:hypothetical protein